MKFLSIIQLCLLLLCQLSFSGADVSISKPSSGQTFKVSGSSATVDITLSDDGNDPNVDKAETYTFLLCTGSNSNIDCHTTLASGKSLTDKSYTATIPSSAGADGVYFIQVYVTYSNGHTIHYSKRFKLSGMSGNRKPSGSLSDSPPSAELSVTTANPTATMDVSKSFSVPYTKQTGIFRFAPMQSQPGSTVTATTWSRQFPTSAVTYYSAARPSPACHSTITPGWSYTRTSDYNYASALGTPTAWYAASLKVKKPTLSSASSSTTSTKQKRFWDFD